ncbi:hypothetical protein G2W53_017435 [Senna tora]|uniref:MULE transposase domain-containing protein n=1 Tax=Senna tora TaxID=362788 RepID=A0A834TSS8_9FABA|nr:hypothetical protein G2W53_017435 [Senna tora]
MISKYDGPHSCASTAIANDHPKLDSDMIAGVIAGLVAEKADIPISLVVQTVKKGRGFTVSYKKAWRGKQKAIARVYGSWVDRTFLYDKYKYSLLIAMGLGSFVQQADGLDGDCATSHAGDSSVVPDRGHAGGRQRSPAQTFVLGAQTLEHVVKDCDVFLISDRETGLLAALENPGTGWEPPLGHNVFCIRHVASNLNSKFRNRAIRALLMKAGHEYTGRGCQGRLKAIRLLNKDAAGWIKKFHERSGPVHRRGSALRPLDDKARRILERRLEGVPYLPVTALVQATLYKVAEFFNNRRQQVQAQINAEHVLCEELWDTIFMNLEIARICKVTLRNEEVNLRWRNSTTSRNGGPTGVVGFTSIEACADVTHEFRLYVDPIYKLETMLMAYSQLFHPIGGEEYWPHVSGRPVMPNPQVLRPPGRPRSTRIHNEMDWKELGNKPKCSLCRVEGHTKKKCPNKKPMQP